MGIATSERRAAAHHVSDAAHNIVGTHNVPEHGASAATLHDFRVFPAQSLPMACWREVVHGLSTDTYEQTPAFFPAR